METFNVYFNKQKIENSHSLSLAKSIFRLGLKKGDTFTSYSFNYFEDENTDYKPEIEYYQNVLLKIEKIEVSLIDTWNGNVNSIVDIFLKSKRHSYENI